MPLDTLMKTPSQFSSPRRPRKNILSWFGRGSARPRGRSREDQITIEILRYRVAHPEAVLEKNGGVTYSGAFQEFVLQRYAQEEGRLTRREFAQAAEIPWDALRTWLAAVAPPVARPTDASKAEYAIAAAPEKTPRLATVAVEEQAPVFSWAALAQWARGLFESDPFEVFSVTDYGQIGRAHV